MLTISPISIKKAMLKPNEKMVISIILDLFAINLRIIYPGTNDRYRNPITCLTIEMSKNMARQNISSKNSIVARKFTDLLLDVLIGYTSSSESIKLKGQYNIARHKIYYTRPSLYMY